MKTASASFLALLLTGLFAAAFLPSCNTLPTGAVQTPEQIARRNTNIRNGASIVTLAAFQATPESGRPKLAANVRLATTAILALTSDKITPAEIQRLVLQYVGTSKPEYQVLAQVLADQLANWSTGLSAVPTVEIVVQITLGVNAAATAYAP